MWGAEKANGELMADTGRTKVRSLGDETPMIVQQVVHRTCESRKQVNADKAVMKWCVKQCAVQTQEAQSKLWMA